MRYTSTLISKTIKGVDGVERLYKARKISAIWASKECFKLAKVLIPAGGAAVDAVMDKKERDDLLLDPVSSTFGSMLSMFTSHVEDEHWDDLSRKLLGSLQLGDKEITDLDDHFDNYQGDYFEVLIWLFTENFKDFFFSNVMFRSLIDKMLALLSPEMKSTIENLKKDLLNETNMQS
ncbi:tail assembly chaperone [Shewanella sp. phage 1/40]|uniref:tail assembly chaperone n=1 Tax=Shewanella phage 1/4 TaxID=1458859 RepID=UPI0004F7C776|nr:tail assembly chaperone [Shewanella sp. phage 1/4]YP_009104155.1 tail assembly chaperone [Shewanella sp. phage 1/40]AHK11262.1 tail assembly chaperone [Shewanella sp. phage 1/4]AHK11563.1 tail assembly chaperone [Shewanella sp. phage 1/40]